jgi:hypothetical protein
MLYKYAEGNIVGNVTRKLFNDPAASKILRMVEIPLTGAVRSPLLPQRSEAFYVKRNCDLAGSLNGPIRFFDKFNKNVTMPGRNQGNLIDFATGSLEF